MCCNHHVGNSHTNKLTDCKKKCSSVVSGKKIEVKKVKKSQGKKGDKKGKTKAKGKKQIN